MDPTQPLTQRPPPVFIPQPEPNYLKTIILSVLIITTLGLITYLFFQNQKLQKQVSNPQVSPTIQVPSPTSQSISPTPKTSSSISLPPDETANWKTYISMWNYSIKYPSSFYLLAPTPGVSEYTLETEIRKNKGNDPNKPDDYLNHKIKIETYNPVPKASEISGYVDEDLREARSYQGLINMPEAQKITINNQETILIKVDSADHTSETYFIYDNSHFVKLTFIDDLKSESEPTFKKIISTFKFVN